METVSKNKRGRPAKPLVSSEYSEFLRLQFPAVTSKRGIRNKELSMIALSALNFAPEFEHIATREKMMFTVLYELGRLVDAELIRIVAREVCEAKLKGRGAVAYIRMRRGASTNVNVSGLSCVIANAVIAYVVQHGMSIDAVTLQQALEDASDISLVVLRERRMLAS